MKKITLVIVVLAVFSGIIFYKDTLYSLFNSVLNEQAKKETQPNFSRNKSSIKVITTPVIISENNQTYKAIGTAKASQSVDIYPLSSGEVKQVFFNSGQRIQKNDLLIQLDDRSEKLEFELAQVNLNKAKNLLNRYKQASNALSEMDLDSAQSSYEIAKINLEKAKLNLDNRQIKSPINGTVGIANVNIGDKVNSSTLIAGIDNLFKLWIDFYIPENLASHLRNLSQNASDLLVSTPAYPNQNFVAKFSEQANRVNENERNLLVRAVIDNIDNQFKPGMSFEINWNIAGKYYPTIPEVSLQWEREGAYIWVIKNSKAIKTQVNVVVRKDSRVLVEGDLAEGDRVVIEGIQRLRDKVEVEILK